MKRLGLFFRQIDKIGLLILAFTLTQSLDANSLTPLLSQIDCSISLMAMPPAHIPSFDRLLYKGYTFAIGQEITFLGEPRQITFGGPLGKKVSVHGATARIERWTTTSGDDPKYVGLVFDQYPDEIYHVLVDEVLKSPEIQWTYSKEKSRIQERQYEEAHYIFIDKVNDPESTGYINRALVSPQIINYSDAEHSAGYVIYKFAKNFKLAKKLGFYFDAQNNILYYPDELSFKERLERVYKEWGVKDGLQSREINGMISAHEYARLILENNTIGRSSIQNYEMHWHDLDSHTLGWIAGVEVMKILRERLRFLFAAEKIIHEYLQTCDSQIKDRALQILDRVTHFIDREEVYDTIEVALPRGQELAGLLDPLPQKQVWINRIEIALLTVGGKSEYEIKKSILSLSMPKDLRAKLASISASKNKIGKQEIGPLMKKIIKRFQ